MSNGGDKPPSMKGRKLSAETRAKMSAARTGKKRPPEVCAKISATKKGKLRPPEVRAKVSAARLGIQPANKGKTASPEARAKMSAAKKGKPSNRKGAKFSAESRAKMSAARKGKITWNKGIPCAPEVKAKISETLKKYFMAAAFLEGLGGKNNIADVTNCATRLRVTVKDDSLIKSPAYFTEHGTHGLVHNGKAIQVIVGLSVPQVRERFENLLNSPDAEIAQLEEKAAESMILKAIVSGKIVDITEVPDEMFAQKMMGDGVAIQPTSETVCAPADAEVTMIAEGSLHAIGLHLANGADILIHIGIDTVNLNGKGFKVFTKTGAKVAEGDKLIQFDRKVIANADYKDIVIVAVTNSASYPQIQKLTGNAKVGQTDMIKF